MMRYTGERAVPWNPSTGAAVMTSHMARYAWAARWCWHKRIVDLGCGCGYGTYLLSMIARGARGLDVDENAIAFARHKFYTPTLTYRCQDVMNDKLPSAEMYVALEVLEHLDDPAALLSRLNAPLVWSLPVNDNSQFHKRLYSLTDIEDLMGPVQWAQDGGGTIVPIETAWFNPTCALGIWESDTMYQIEGESCA